MSALIDDTKFSAFCFAPTQVLSTATKCVLNKKRRQPNISSTSNVFLEVEKNFHQKENKNKLNFHHVNGKQEAAQVFKCKYFSFHATRFK